MEQVGLMSIILVVLVSYLYVLGRMSKLKRIYHNDERWQQLKLRAGQITKAYYEGLIILIAILLVILLWMPTPMLVSLDRILGIGAIAIMVGQLIEYLAVRRLDGMM
ncbi:hypothetical protein [Lactiplantibacillus pentosus]|uniref:hypothetical protein n=1 Tax=Lactiplantibacillus pentosus TaxID=1589 RepID=UPI0021A8B9BC|nr:hypothetical protein [Lactiplantibacillus pentosus]MCT3296639.1 hypothetical protein [Lactiplantibacillus pentosus]